MKKAQSWKTGDILHPEKKGDFIMYLIDSKSTFIHILGRS
jgi:hypothetical protein